MTYFAYPPRQESELRNDIKISVYQQQLLFWIHLGNINNENGRKRIFLDQIQMLGFLFFIFFFMFDTHKALKSH